MASKDPKGHARPNVVPAVLTPKSTVKGLSFLEKHDMDLKGIMEKLGPPPMWRREPGFPMIKGLKSRPSAGELAVMAEAWQPWRAVAARLLLHYYLNHKRC
jgi:3-methyladenine DNA glycosylase/8-oxoguanine DNA glycosylase